MFADVIDMLFGCWHKNYSFPITAKKANNCYSRYSRAANVTGTYVVCLDCGKEFPYDWEQMKVLAAEPEPTEAAPLAVAAAAGFEKIA